VSAEWTIEGESDGQYIQGEYNGADVYITVEVSAIGTPPTFREHVAIEQAPLHLIAAAPLMLEVLEVLCALECFMVPTEPSIQKALRRGRQALDAARGESPTQN
tara:strand:+ start:395 stop:706 length:312 start_codon:yes stop_codon:yes gene_type:complete